MTTLMPRRESQMVLYPMQVSMYIILKKIMHSVYSGSCSYLRELFLSSPGEMSASELKKLQRKQKKAQLKAKAKAREEKGKPHKP
jgi:hypothetical protein